MLCPTLRDVNLGAQLAARYFGSFARVQSLGLAAMTVRYMHFKYILTRHNRAGNLEAAKDHWNRLRRLDLLPTRSPAEAVSFCAYVSARYNPDRHGRAIHRATRRSA